MADFTIFRTDILISKSSVIKYFKENYWLLILIAIFIFSFALDVFVLTRYSLSYGIDGAFYDIQVCNILQYGFPISNDPPLVYYLLTPFVVLSGNSFLGVKIGMALMGSLLVFPAFLLTECYTHGKVGGSKIPALLSAFMVTVNVNYFALLGDFLQNLVGVLLLSVFLYFAVMWFADTKDWRKYGVLTVLFLCLNLLTHIYTGAVAVTLFFALLIFSIMFKTWKARKLPVFDLKILGILTALVIAFFVILFLAYPVMYTKFSTVISSINSSATQTGGTAMGMSSPVSGVIFLSLPYLLGIVAALIILYRGWKEKITTIISSEMSKTSFPTSAPLNETVPLINKTFSSKMNKNTLLAWVYISLAALLAVLVMIPASDYQSRFLLMAFLPIGLLIPLGLKFLETEFLARYSHKTLTTIVVAGLALVFAFSCFYTASESFGNLEPTITSEQYQELLEIKASFANVTDENMVIVASDFQNKYWVEYVLGDVGNGNNITVLENVQGVQENYQNSSIYAVTAQSNHTAQSNQTSSSPNSSKLSGTNAVRTAGSSSDNSPALSFLLPYGPPILPNSLDIMPSISSMSETKNPMQGDNQPAGMNNSTNRPPGNTTSSTGGPAGGMPSNLTDNMQPHGNMTNKTNQPQGEGNSPGAGSDDQSRQIADSLTSSGTTVFSGNYFKIVLITL